MVEPGTGLVEPGQVLAVIGVIVLAIAGPADASSHGKPATWVNVTGSPGRPG